MDSRARQEQAQNGVKVDAAERAKTSTLSIAYTLAGAGGLEPPNGGIKIQVVCVIDQSAFRKNAEIRPQSDQELSGYFGMPYVAHLAVTRLSEGRGHKFESCRARH